MTLDEWKRLCVGKLIRVSTPHHGMISSIGICTNVTEVYDAARPGYRNNSAFNNGNPVVWLVFQKDGAPSPNRYWVDADNDPETWHVEVAS